MAMYIGGCISPREAIASHCSSILNSGHHEPNVYIGKNFFYYKNYRSILGCLDGGYNIAMDFIRSMTEYHDLRKADTVRITSYCKIYDSRLKQQSSLSAYSTNSDAQFQTIQTFEKHVKVINKCCNNVQQVIDRYQEQVNAMYPNKRFSTTRKHYRTNEMENSFKRARSPLRKVLDTLKKLQKKKKKALDALHNINLEIDDLSFDSTTNEDKKINAINKKKKKENKLQEIEENIAETEEKRIKKEIIYIAEATEIFKQCQQLEKQRLDEIRQALIDFNKAVHSSKYSTKLDSIYEELISNIETKQNLTADLDYWAQAYGVNNLTTIVSSATNENETDYDSDSAIDDDDEVEDE